ncbi:MAG TPA: ATP-binding cassette domain-containing protein [Lapidilactobacillus dextrinicus]|uniref:ABC transporter, ATP-binding protein n=2 Tax=Lapidilactobacillus dextrinicus TaxID=51664 RepID=A0A0R2BS64_9LACO|nr:ATP-binding cassette domain-containing protein [Lapidilactobacillus dextrinicus]KRM78291.1 ABC transporter, ATP-binding protein [Lapidilactobacillus dextrinicus DSM 20335]QFG47287.1 ATP-binding cassette domain-containing protein [Lapidilactobacillus dextrinicus]HJE15631.1 ATP-binding cassette domain-containing protein [Lapidilactobacillus dextrinicus]
MSILTMRQVDFVVEEKPIINGINLQVNSGDYLTISGPSGGGKSTLLKLIATLLTPTSGEILFNNQAQASYPTTDYRKEVSYCFQQPTLFGETVQDNLAFPFLVRGKAFEQAKVDHLLDLVDLPESYLTKKITELSGGERQRVALIRNLIFLPKVLLLDEVTVGLDSASKAIVKKLIQRVHADGVTILLVTHESDILAQAQQVIWIKEGKIVDESAISQ